MRRYVLGILLGVLLSAGVPTEGQSQQIGVVQSDILVLDPDRLFNETLFGQRLNAEYLERRDELIARNRKLEAELEAEEQALSDLREEKTPEDFRTLADAFDAKVQDIRRDSNRAVQDLERSRERAPVVFMRSVEPVLIQIMQDTGGAVLLDLRAVLLRASAIDVTDLAITRIDEQIGDGAQSNDPDEPEVDPQE